MIVFMRLPCQLVVFGVELFGVEVFEVEEFDAEELEVEVSGVEGSDGGGVKAVNVIMMLPTDARTLPNVLMSSVFRFTDNAMDKASMMARISHLLNLLISEKGDNKASKGGK